MEPDIREEVQMIIDPMNRDIGEFLQMGKPVSEVESWLMDCNTGEAAKWNPNINNFEPKIPIHPLIKYVWEGFKK